MALEITSVAHVGDVPERARKGNNASHIMVEAPVMIGSWDVKGICTTRIGSSGDDAVTMGTDLGGVACKRCDKIYAEMVKRDAAERDAAELTTGDPVITNIRIKGTPAPKVNRAELIAAEKVRRAARKAERDARDAARENSAPTLPGIDVVASTGLTSEAMAQAVVEYYANGHAVPAEIANLPDPSAPRVWNVSAEKGGDTAYIGCEGAGGVKFVNAEGTHGKCLGCSAYIPLLPEPECREEGAPVPSGKPCGGVGSVPVAGSRVTRDNHAVSVSDDFQGKHSARCSGCNRIIAVNKEGTMRRHNGTVAPVAVADDTGGEFIGRIGSHFAGGVSAPANRTTLSSKSIDTVEHGSVPGDPGEAVRRRREEILCGKSRKVIKGASGGIVDCPNELCTRPVELKSRPGKEGLVWFVPDHSLPGELVKFVTTGNKGAAARVRKVTPRGSGADAGKGSRDHGSVDGSANVSASSMAPVRPGGWLGHAGTGQMPATLRTGIDPDVAGRACPVEECGGKTPEIAHFGKSKSWRRRHSTKVGALIRKREAEREIERAAEIAAGKAIPVAERRERRKAASIGSFAEGVNAHSGVVTHGPRAGKSVTKPAPETRGERAARRRAAKAAV